MRKLKIQPSLLEYSEVQLLSKLGLILNNQKNFLSASGQEKICLHLDLVMKYFAREESVLASLSFPLIYSALKENLGTLPLRLSVHFMGITDDLDRVYNFLNDINIPENWSLIIYLPINFASSWSTIFKQKSITIGAWYNLDELNSFDVSPNIKEYLLLTVQAGKSGQNKSAAADKIVRNIARKNPNCNFLLDGGWKIGSKGGENCQIVSYSSFWNSFMVS